MAKITAWTQAWPLDSHQREEGRFEVSSAKHIHARDDSEDNKKPQAKKVKVDKDDSNIPDGNKKPPAKTSNMETGMVVADWEMIDGDDIALEEDFKEVMKPSSSNNIKTSGSDKFEQQGEAKNFKERLESMQPSIWIVKTLAGIKRCLKLKSHST